MKDQKLFNYMRLVRRASLYLFRSLMLECGKDWDDLIKGYFSKNVLNFVRQDFGYKEGTYKKIWDGREDNVHLEELMIELDSGAPDFADQLYAALVHRYKTLA